MLVLIRTDRQLILCHCKFALMTALTVLPSLVLGMTSFTRIIIVLSILRQAMGTQQTPPNQVLIAIALFLSFFIMTPTFNMMNEQVLTPYLDGQMPAETALEDGSAIMKNSWCGIRVKTI